MGGLSWLGVMRHLDIWLAQLQVMGVRHIFIVRITIPKCNVAMLRDPGIPGKMRRGGDLWSRDLIQESPVPHEGSAATINLHAVFPEGEDFHNNPRPVPFLLSDSGLVLDTDMVTNLERIQLPAAFVVRDFHPCISLGKAGLPIFSVQDEVFIQLIESILKLTFFWWMELQLIVYDKLDKSRLSDLAR